MARARDPRTDLTPPRGTAPRRLPAPRRGERGLDLPRQPSKQPARQPARQPSRPPRRTPTSHTGRSSATVPAWWRPPKNTRPTATGDQPRHRADPRTGSTPTVAAPARTRRQKWRLVRRTLLWSTAGVLATPLLAFVIGYIVFAIPSPDDAVNNQVALVSFADGSRLATLVPEAGNRTKVPITAVPVWVREAVLAAEDRSYYTNPGFDLTGIVRAAWNQLRGGAGGGSTITQQYVKNTLVGNEQTLWRKYKELVLSVKLSQEYSKDEILGDYLNAIYFGRGAYGIQAASQAYFGKDVGALTPSEGALLAGLIQSPSRWDPAISPERAVQRWNFVLDGMVAQGWLSPADRATAQFPPTQPRRSTGGGVPADAEGHIVTAVTQELADLGITEQDLAQGGLRITTTIDPRRQQAAVKAAHDTLAGQPADLRSALVAVDPMTGDILAYYGGDNGLGLDYARTQRLAGSTFKPFVVLAGLLHDPPIGLGETFSGTAQPGLRNADGADCGRCDLKEAMTLSNNVVFNTLAKQIGPDAVAAAAHAAGITAPLDNPTEGIALGNKEVSTLDLASSYATLAAGGIWHQPHLVASVVTADNTVLYQADTQGERRFPEKVARNVVEAMLDVAPADGLALPGGRPVAAKTGTVESRFEGQNNDAWMAGSTPTVSTSVWIGTDMNDPIKTASGKPVEGKSLPGETWRDFMVEAHDDQPVEQFAPFRPIGEPPSTVDDAAPPATATASPTGTPTPTPGAEPTPVAPSGAPRTSAPATGRPAGPPSVPAEPPAAEPSSAPRTTDPPAPERADCTPAEPCD